MDRQRLFWIDAFFREVMLISKHDNRLYIGTLPKHPYYGVNSYSAPKCHSVGLNHVEPTVSGSGRRDFAL